jgi:hypothetical protein
LNAISYRETFVDSSRKLADMVVHDVGNNEQKFFGLLDLVVEDNYPLSMRAARAMSLCIEKHPKLLTSMLNRVLKKLKTFRIDGVKRSILRSITLENAEIAEDHQGLLVDACFEFLVCPTEPIAVRYYAMDIIHSISHEYPEIKEELLLTLETQLDGEASNLKYRMKEVIRALRKELHSR